MISKATLIKHLDKFPEQISIEELIEKLIFIEKLETRIKESETDDTISEEDLKAEMAEWLK